MSNARRARWGPLRTLRAPIPEDFECLGLRASAINMKRSKAPLSGSEVPPWLTDSPLHKSE